MSGEPDYQANYRNIALLLRTPIGWLPIIGRTLQATQYRSDREPEFGFFWSSKVEALKRPQSRAYIRTIK